MLTTDVLVVDIDTLGRQPLEGIERLLLLVVEAAIEAELFDDEVQLLVAADGANDLETLALGDLADDLADGTGSTADEDGLALLGLADLLVRRPSGQAGHAKGTEEEAEVLEVVLVVDLGLHKLADNATHDLTDLLLGEGGILGDGQVGNHQVAGLVVGVVGLENLGDGVVGDGPVEGVSGSVGLDAGVTHAAALVGVEGGVEDGDGHTTRGRSGVGVEATVLDDEVLTRDGVARGNLLEDKSLVLDLGHFGGLLCCTLVGLLDSVKSQNQMRRTMRFISRSSSERQKGQETDSVNSGDIAGINWGHFADKARFRRDDWNHEEMVTWGQILFPPTSPLVSAPVGYFVTFSPLSLKTPPKKETVSCVGSR